MGEVKRWYKTLIKTTVGPFTSVFQAVLAISLGTSRMNY